MSFYWWWLLSRTSNCVGIDESNHGITPEVYVACLSSDAEVSSWSHSKLSKPRPSKAGKDRLSAELEGLFDLYERKVRFLVLYPEHVYQIGLTAIKVPVISELLIKLIEDERLDPSSLRAIIDGGLADVLLCDIASRVSRVSKREFVKFQIFILMLMEIDIYLCLMVLMQLRIDWGEFLKKFLAAGEAGLINLGCFWSFKKK